MENQTAFASRNGYNDWRHLSDRIKSHEHSIQHMENYAKWKDFANRVEAEKTVDSELSTEFREEKKRLREVFKRIISFVLFFASQNIAFRGKSSNIHDPTNHNGNFNQLVKTVSTFDHVLEEYWQKSGKVHYLSPQTQNELIKIIGSKVRKQILEWVRKSKYFSIILDTTPDVSRLEQKTLILRYLFLNEMTNRYEIKESFIEFVNILVKTGQGISEVALNTLKSIDLNPNDMRGQGYDNGSNFKGKNIGVQKKILDQYPRAFFLPCSNHSLNLVVNDAAAASGAIFFSIVQHIFTFLSSSTNRWDILMKHLIKRSALTTKPICKTRWASRIDAIKPLRLNLNLIIDALREIEETNRN